MALRKVRVQDLQPGMFVERLTPDLDFVYREVEKVVPQKVGGRTKSYRVYLVGYQPGTGQDAFERPFVMRPTGSGSQITVKEY